MVKKEIQYMGMESLFLQVAICFLFKYFQKYLWNGLDIFGTNSHIISGKHSFSRS